MNSQLSQIIEKASKIEMTPSDREAQRRSFAYGNSHIENSSVTREMIDAAAERIVRDK